MIKIRDDQEKGSPIMFNDSQISLWFLMLSHYIADAHVPPHCDNCDFYGPSTIHPDMEDYWENEIKIHYELAANGDTFVLDKDGFPERHSKDSDYLGTMLSEAEEMLNKRKWEPIENKKGEVLLLGKNNKNLWDYLVSVCFLSYLVSTEYISISVTEPDYKKLKILNDKGYFEKLKKMSPDIIADAIDSIALLWLFTWSRNRLLEVEIVKKNKEWKVKSDEE